MRQTIFGAALFLGALGTLATIGACTANDTTTAEQAVSGAGCSVNVADPRACDPADTKKTTVCHIPPGNPANAHTLCVGNDAVPAHLDHGDFVGTCVCDGSGGDGSGSDNTGSDGTGIVP